MEALQIVVMDPKGVRKWFRKRAVATSVESAVDAGHVRVRSVLGINDKILSDMNKSVPEGDEPTEFCLDLDKPFGGFDKAHFRIGHASAANACQLQIVRLTRELPDGATENDLADEWQASCDFVSDILGVIPRQIQLPGVYGLRDSNDREVNFRRLGVTSWVNFRLAADQSMAVGLTEPVYVLREGTAVAVCHGCVEVLLVFHMGLLNEPMAMCKKEIDFGPDCREKLAKVLKDGRCH